MLMVSLRVGERALPLAWHLKPKGHEVSASRRRVLEMVVKLLPEGSEPSC